MHGDKDLNPTEDYHSPDKPRRADHNVTKFRNILVEFDKEEPLEQLKFVKSIDLPYSTALFSGKKSVHLIISLETELSNIDEYRALVSRIYLAIGLDKVDKANKNPSRLSRFPNVMREETGQKQAVIKIQSRIPNQILEDWLISRGVDARPAALAHPRPVLIDSNGKGKLRGSTANFLMSGAIKGERNQTLFKAACDFATCDYDIDEAIDQLYGRCDLSRSETIDCIKSAYSHVKARAK